MARYEVFIPAAETAGFNVTFRVDAQNWMAALKTGMQKLGEQGAAMQNILVDIQDDESVHVTESSSGRVFRIRELTEADVAQAQPKRPARPAERRSSGMALGETDPSRPQPQLPLRPALGFDGPPTQPGMPALARPAPQPADITRPSIPAASIVAPIGEPASEQKTRIEAWPVAPTPMVQPAVQPAPRPARPASAPQRRGRVEPESVVELEAPTRPVVGKIGRAQRRNQKEEIEDLLAEVFERVQEVYAQKDPDAALYYLLDLALEKIPAESGTVFQADAASGDLTFRAVRGPRAKEVLDAQMVIPAGTGVVGFCAVEGVSLALSDIQKDPRYYSVVAQKVKYTPTSVLCAPMMTHGRTFGCLQILNRRDGHLFNEVEVGLLGYIAHQAALYLNNL
jgi:hypothetical protein